jgi:hypothetical protein
MLHFVGVSRLRKKLPSERSIMIGDCTKPLAENLSVIIGNYHLITTAVTYINVCSMLMVVKCKTHYIISSPTNVDDYSDRR